MEFLDPRAARGASADEAADFGSGVDPASRALLEQQLFLARLQQRRPIVTYVLLATIALTFGLQYLWGTSSTATLVRMGAEVPSQIRAGELHRLLAPVFLHGSLPHVFMNSLVLIMLGPFVERLLGSARFLILFTLSGLCGSVFGTWFPLAAKFGLSVGASGAIFGLLGASAVIGMWPRGQIPQLIAGDLRKSALINFGINLVASLRPHVDYLAHLGGAIAGIVLVGSGLLRPTVSLSLERDDEPPPGAATWMLRGLAALCALALYGSLAIGIVRGAAWQLTKPLKFERQSVGQTGLSIDVPVLAGHSRMVQSDDESSDAVWDDLAAPLHIGLRISKRWSDAQAADDPAELRKSFDAAADELRAFKPGKDLALIESPEEVTVRGWPALQMKFRSDARSDILLRIFQVRPRYAVTLEVHLLNENENPVTLDPAQLLESLREDAAP